jgi:hypothetical protein
MAVLRFLSALFLLVATVALVADATPPLAGTAPFAATPLVEHWKEIAPGSLEAAKAAIEGSSAPWAWEDLIAPVVGVPTFVLFGVLGLACGYGGRRRRRVNIYVN